MEHAERVRLALEAPIGAHLLQPDSRVIARAGWYQVHTPSVRDGALNEVVRCEELEPASADAAIAREVARHAGLGLDLKWVVAPTTRVADLPARLARAGFTTTWWARAMAVEPARHAAEPSLAPGVSVGPVEDAAGGEAWAQVVAEGWGQALERARGDAARALAGGRHALFLARLDGRPAGAAATFVGPAGYLTGAVVLESARGRGLYRALVAARVAALARAGVALAVTQARDHSSAPILDRLGFETLFRFPVALRPAR